MSRIEPILKRIFLPSKCGLGPSQTSWPIWLVLLVTLSVAGFCVWKAEEAQSVQTATVPISQIRLGDRVPGKNPKGDVEDAPVLAELWRAVSIEATLQDGSRLELDLLRPESWVRAHDLTVGAAVPVEFGETHTQSGAGKVKRINPCPPLRAGPGKIVTGLFRHETPEIFTVSTADGERLNATAGTWKTCPADLHSKASITRAAAGFRAVHL